MDSGPRRGGRGVGFSERHGVGGPKDQTVTTEMIRLNIGAGDTVIPGFTPIDAKLGHDACKLNYLTGSVDEVYSSHCLEHLHHSKTAIVVKEWCRVLKPGGRIRIAIPDFEKVLALHKTDPERFSSGFMSAWLHGTYDVDTDRHQAILYQSDLEAMLRSNGIDAIGPWEGEYDDQAKHNSMTLNVGGYKREVKIPRNPKVVMVLSTPRFGPVDTFKSIADGCQSLGWLFVHWGGTEWGKGLESVIQNVIAQHNPDYVMTIDYDGVFDPADCQKILDFMQTHPEVDAVWPAQAHRHLDLPLGLSPPAAIRDYYDFSGDFTPMGSGHFGCTMIRRQVFDTLPHPWFWSIPDPVTGDWANGSDADITFWRWCYTYGFVIGQINTVQIGHLEWCVKWMTPKGIIWQPIQNYRAKGKPAAAMFDGQFWVDKAKRELGPAVAGAIPPLPVPPSKQADSKIENKFDSKGKGEKRHVKDRKRHRIDRGDQVPVGSRQGGAGER